MLWIQLSVQHVTYIEDLKLCRQCSITELIRTLSEICIVHGRTLLLDKKLHFYVKKMTESSAMVSSKVVMEAACGLR